MPSFDPLAHAKSDLVPLLEALCRLAEEEKQSDQQRYFGAIQRSISGCRETVDLAEPLMELSMSAFLGFQYSPAASFLLDQLLMGAQELTEVLSLDENEVN